MPLKYVLLRESRNSARRGRFPKEACNANFAKTIEVEELEPEHSGGKITRSGMVATLVEPDATGWIRGGSPRQ